MKTLQCLRRVGCNGWRLYSKLSYKHHIGEEPLRPLTLGQVLDGTAKKYPDRLVLIAPHQNQKITFSELVRESDKLAAGFQNLELKKGDRVGLWAPNMIEWLITSTACTRLGLVVVTLNPAYLANDMEYCINKVEIQTVVCPKQIKYNFYDILNEVVPNLRDSNPKKLNCEKVPSLKNIILISDDTQKGVINFNELVDSVDEKSAQKISDYQHLIGSHLPLNIQFTSGTTGKPKAAVVTHFNVVNNSYFLGKRNELGRKHHTICVQNPFFHAFGYTITIAAALNHGATMVIPSYLYSPSENLKAIHEQECSIIHGTPTMYVDLIAKQNEKQLNINPEIAVCGGAPCPPHLFRSMKSTLKVSKVKSVYGLSETTAVLFQSLPNDDEIKSTETVGHLSDHIEAKVVDENENLVPFGKPGELYVRGYTTMLYYWSDTGKTDETITKDAWLKTGDQFVLQEDGYGKIVGRLKDMIIRGGENIYPKEIEDFLMTHPEIRDVYVIGLSHERLGEEVCACVKLKEGGQLTLESLSKFCEGKIASYKIPSQLRIVDSFPTTQSGKIQKYLLKEKFDKKI